MKRQPTTLPLAEVPSQLHTFLEGTAVFDSSCSPEARVWFLDKGPGFYLKEAPKGKLEKEAALTAYFHGNNMAAEVLAYERLDSDWLLTRRVPGEDCTYAPYLENPEKLCDTIAQVLRTLHETSFAGCPVPDRTGEYLATARCNHAIGRCDLELCSGDWHFASPEEAWQFTEETGQYLKTDTLLHGDYCLPNIILNEWRFSGFIDLDNAGVGDRHVDLFWAIWSLNFNLKTNKYRNRFLDAYGRDCVCEELLRTVAAIEVFG